MNCCLTSTQLHIYVIWNYYVITGLSNANFENKGTLQNFLSPHLRLLLSAVRVRGIVDSVQVRFQSVNLRVLHVGGDGVV